MLLNGTVGDGVAFHCEAESFGNKQALKYHWLKILNDNTTMLLSFANTSTLQFIATPDENGTLFSTAGRLNCKLITTKLLSLCEKDNNKKFINHNSHTNTIVK